MKKDTKNNEKRTCSLLLRYAFHRCCGCSIYIYPYPFFDVFHLGLPRRPLVPSILPFSNNFCIDLALIAYPK